MLDTTTCPRRRSFFLEEARNFFPCLSFSLTHLDELEKYWFHLHSICLRTDIIIGHIRAGIGAQCHISHSHHLHTALTHNFLLLIYTVCMMNNSLSPSLPPSPSLSSLEPASLVSLKLIHTILSILPPTLPPPLLFLLPPLPPTLPSSSSPPTLVLPHPPHLLLLLSPSSPLVLQIVNTRTRSSCCSMTTGLCLMRSATPSLR